MLIVFQQFIVFLKKYICSVSDVWIWVAYKEPERVRPGLSKNDLLCQLLGFISLLPFMSTLQISAYIYEVT
jgi:hypothetical protein